MNHVPYKFAVLELSIYRINGYIDSVRPSIRTYPLTDRYQSSIIFARCNEGCTSIRPTDLIIRDRNSLQHNRFVSGREIIPSANLNCQICSITESFRVLNCCVVFAVTMSIIININYKTIYAKDVGRSLFEL